MIQNYNKFKEKGLTSITKYDGGAVVIVSSFDNLGEEVNQKHDILISSLDSEIANLEKNLSDINARILEIHELRSDISPDQE